MKQSNVIWLKYYDMHIFEVFWTTIRANACSSHWSASLYLALIANKLPWQSDHSWSLSAVNQPAHRIWNEWVATLEVFTTSYIKVNTTLQNKLEKKANLLTVCETGLITRVSKGLTCLGFRNRKTGLSFYVPCSYWTISTKKSTIQVPSAMFKEPLAPGKTLH